MSVVEEVKRDLKDWKLSRIVTVTDTGFNSEQNRRTLQGAGDAFILGEKMRLGRDGSLPEALSRPGRFRTLGNGLRVKEVIINKGSVTARRFVVVHNPEQAARDEQKRSDIIQEAVSPRRPPEYENRTRKNLRTMQESRCPLRPTVRRPLTAERRITALGDLTGKHHTKAVCDLLAHKVYGRYLREQKNGKLVINKTKVAAEAKLDGKYLISTSDEHLSAEDVAMGYSNSTRSNV